jgi:hypothetical protein
MIMENNENIYEMMTNNIKMGDQETDMDNKANINNI